MVRKQDRRRGNNIVEFAIASSVIFMMALGALDFGRLFYESIAIAGAAQAGVQRGIYSSNASDDSTEIEAAGEAGLSDVDGATVTSEQFCDCPSNPGVGVDCETARCVGYGLSRLYVRVRIEKDFEVFGPWPGIPQSTEIDLSTWMRSR